MFKQIRIYSCGHRAEFNVEKKPEAKELQVYIPCPQCRNKINDTILTISELNDLKPPLRGTPAQIEYGDKNRQRFINEWVKRASDKQAEIIRKIIKNEDHGGFWMDNKDILKEERFVNEYTPSAKRNNKSKKKKTSEDSAQQRTAAQLKQDIIQHIVKPEEIKSNILIYIELENKTTINVFPTQYNNEIENILKDMNYSYLRERNCYTREITEYTGNYIDRAAELGIKLNSNGYAVSILNTQVMGMIRQKVFKPEITRWVKRFNQTHLYLDWQGYERVLCNRALSFIPGAYWEQSYKKVIVPVSSYRDIISYADKNDFAIDDKSRNMIENARRKGN